MAFVLGEGQRLPACGAESEGWVLGSRWWGSRKVDPLFLLVSQRQFEALWKSFPRHADRK